MSIESTALDDALVDVLDLRRRIGEAIDLLAPDGRCWVVDRDGDEWPHKASACLLCHVRAVLRGEEPPAMTRTEAAVEAAGPALVAEGAARRYRHFHANTVKEATT